MKTAKAPEPYIFDPLPDITAYELALVVQTHDHVAFCSRWITRDEIDVIMSQLSDSVRRHYKLGEHRLILPKPTSAIEN